MMMTTTKKRKRRQRKKRKNKKQLVELWEKTSPPLQLGQVQPTFKPNLPRGTNPCQVILAMQHPSFLVGQLGVSHSIDTLSHIQSGCGPQHHCHDFWQSWQTVVLSFLHWWPLWPKWFLFLYFDVPCTWSWLLNPTNWWNTPQQFAPSTFCLSILLYFHTPSYCLNLISQD